MADARTGHPYSFDTDLNSIASERYPDDPREDLDYVLYRSGNARPANWTNNVVLEKSAPWTVSSWGTSYTYTLVSRTSSGELDTVPDTGAITHNLDASSATSATSASSTHAPPTRSPMVSRARDATRTSGGARTVAGAACPRTSRAADD